MALRLAHVSDLHVPSKWRGAPWLYLGKRLIGTLNYKLRRGKQHPAAAVEALVRTLSDDKTIDHVAITGDITNVSLPEEFEAARKFLQPLIDARGAGFVSIIPGNHDRYTFGSQRGRLFEKTFGDCMTSDIDTGAPFPFVRLRKEVAIIGLDSGVATLPFLATGTLGPDQRGRLVRLLDDPRVKGAPFRVALVHHPALRAHGGRDKLLHRLTDDRELVKIVEEKNVDLVLHGHIHLPYTVERGKFRGAGCGSSTMSTEKHRGRINVYVIEEGKLASTEVRTFDPERRSFAHY